MIRPVAPPLPAASLIIASRDRPQLLDETIRSVLAGDELPAEIVVVDQSAAPHPSLPALHPARPCAIRYRHSRATGLSRGRNEGLAAAGCPLVACIDDDMYVEHAWFGALIRGLLAAGPRAVVTGRVLPTAPEGPGGFVPALVVDEAPATYAGRLGKDVLAGGHMAAYKADLAALGGFDPRLGAGSAFPAADDNDLGFRLLEAGYRIVYVPDAVVYHRAWRPARDYYRMRWNYGRGKGGFYTKHLSLRDRYMLRRLGADIGRRLLAFPRRLVYDHRRACGDLVYSLGILLGAGQWMWLERGRRPASRRFR